jgi:hypothetical protein
MGRIYIVTTADPTLSEDRIFGIDGLRVYTNITTAHREARESAVVSPRTFYVVRIETLTQHPAPTLRRKTTGRIRKL